MVALGGSENFYSIYESELSNVIPVVHATIAGTRIIGRMTVGACVGTIRTTTIRAELGWVGRVGLGGEGWAGRRGWEAACRVGQRHGTPKVIARPRHRHSSTALPTAGVWRGRLTVWRHSVVYLFQETATACCCRAQPRTRYGRTSARSRAFNVSMLLKQHSALALVPGSWTVPQQELQHLRNSLPDSVHVQRIEERLSALGNVVACNDYVALVHPDIDRVRCLSAPSGRQTG